MHPIRQPAIPFPVVHGDAGVPDALRGGVAAIGNFDGVHRGHLAVIDAAVRDAAARSLPALAVTFEPHPRQFFRPQAPMFRLTDAATKLRLLAQTGLAGALVLTFDATLASMTAERFVADILVDRLAIAGAAVGDDFHFGHRRGGSPAFLREAGERYGFGVGVVSEHSQENLRISSSAIRDALANGAVADAAAMLGRPWFVTGPVIHGEKRGRDLGFPTANLRLDQNCGLRHGIYAVRVRVENGQVHDGVASFGRRPTFDNGAPLLEAYLFGFSGDLYGQVVDLAFLDWIRPELKFAGVDALVRQMQDDVEAARRALAGSPNAMPPDLQRWTG